MRDAPRDKRVHGLDAADAGDVGDVDGEVFGPCPSCAAELLLARVENPITGRMERALMHPIPFCTYYGETDADKIERDVERARKKKN
jgi:hypothetical protein